MRVEVALDGHEGEDWEGEATHAGQPLLRRQKRRPEMIHEHEGHGDDVKCRRTQVVMSGLVQMYSPFTMLQISDAFIQHLRLYTGLIVLTSVKLGYMHLHLKYKIAKPFGIATDVFLSFKYKHAEAVL